MANPDETPSDGYDRPAGPQTKSRNGMNEDRDIPRFGADELDLG